MKNREELRAEARSRRDGLPESFRREASDRICAILKEACPAGPGRKLFGYVPIGSEADIAPFLEWFLASGGTVALPRTQKGGMMDFYAVPSLDALVPGRFGIPEPPASGTALVPQEGDAVLVPCLLFTREGHRIGYGGGFYDRWLALHPEGNALITAYSVQEGRSSAETHDVPIGRIVTEKGMFHVRGGRKSITHD